MHKNIIGAMVFITGLSQVHANLLDRARRSYLDLGQNWKFSLDPENSGEAAGWAQGNFDDSKWAVLQAEVSYEEQGFPSYDGYSWYRKKIFIPKHWLGSQIRLETDGVGDEYDVFINGQFSEHKGGQDFGSVYLWPVSTEISSFLKYGSENTIAIRVWDRGWYPGGGLWRRVALRRLIDLKPHRTLLPEPILDSHPQWIDLYWKTWDLAWEKIAFGNARNGFTRAFLEEGFNEQIFQWDTVFMTFFAKYGGNIFPAMQSLDNFYRKQRTDGYIQRSYSVATGEEVEPRTAQEPAVNPPLFAWAENTYADWSGDFSRLNRVFPILEKYYFWIQENMRAPEAHGLYFNTQVASGMDNTPRLNSERGGWVDMSSQQALAAKHLSSIATKLGRPEKIEFWNQEFLALSRIINEKLWNKEDSIFYDLNRYGQPTGTKHIGNFWPLLAGVASQEQALHLVKHLKNPAEFFTQNLFPTLSASDPEFNPHGGYWLGSVWAPTNYMVIKGLQNYSFHDFARAASINYLNILSQVYRAELDPRDVNYLDRINGPLHTLWECYAPQSAFPCSPGNGGYARANFVGWTGVGPVALLIENVIGLEFLGKDKKVIWRLEDKKRVGLKNFKWPKNGTISLVAEPSDEGGSREIRLMTTKGFNLEIFYNNRRRIKKILPGQSDFFLDPVSNSLKMAKP